MTAPLHEKVIWFYQDWDDPDLYHIKFDGEEIDLLTIEEAEKKYPRDKYIVLLHEWDDLEGSKT